MNDEITTSTLAPGEEEVLPELNERELELISQQQLTLEAVEAARNLIILSLKHRAHVWRKFSEIKGNEYEQYQLGRVAAYEDAIDTVRVWFPHFKE